VLFVRVVVSHFTKKGTTHTAYVTNHTYLNAAKKMIAKYKKTDEVRENQGWKIVSVGEQRLKLYAEKDNGINKSVA
jgi:hypothetical protein